MLAAAIRIQARFEADVRTVVARDDCSCPIAKELRGATRLIFIVMVDLDNIRVAKIDMKFFESIRRAPGSASSVDRR